MRFYVYSVNGHNVEERFEEMIDSFLEKKVGIQEEFLALDLSVALRAHLLSLFEADKLKQAGIGNDSAFLHDKTIRGDKIYWLDRAHHNVFENHFLDLIDHFVRYLNQTCYTGITGYEFHYALYEEEQFYKRHLDQFRDNNSRAFSMIVYLNSDWQTSDGGELCIYQNGSAQRIAPTNRKCVFFKSDELEHEVLPTNVPRLSITGWLKVG